MPPDPRDAAAFLIYGQELVDCICDCLTAQPNVGCPVCHTVVSGPPSYDQCCEGQLTVHLNRTWLADPWPSQVVAAQRCGHLQLVLEYVITWLTCANVECVCCSVELVVAEKVLTARYLILRALAGCFAEWAGQTERRQGAISEQTPIEPDGTCVGAVTTVLVGLPCLCGCPPEPPTPPVCCNFPSASYTDVGNGGLHCFDQPAAGTCNIPAGTWTVTAGGDTSPYSGAMLVSFSDGQKLFEQAGTFNCGDFGEVPPPISNSGVFTFAGPVVATLFFEQDNGEGVPHPITNPSICYAPA